VAGRSASGNCYGDGIQSCPLLLCCTRTSPKTIHYMSFSLCKLHSKLVLHTAVSSAHMRRQQHSARSDCDTTARICCGDWIWQLAETKCDKCDVVFVPNTTALRQIMNILNANSTAYTVMDKTALHQVKLFSPGINISYTVC
jgi:hypothetical protein